MAPLMVPVIWLVVLAIQDCVVVETTGVTTRGFKMVDGRVRREHEAICDGIRLDAR